MTGRRRETMPRPELWPTTPPRTRQFDWDHCGRSYSSSESSDSSAYPRSPEVLTFDPEVDEQPMPARLVFIGGHRVGSSSLIRRFNLGLYKDEYSPEVTKVMRHTKSLKHPRYGHYVTVQFWDVEGSDSRVALQCAYKAHAIAVVYDVTNRSSFEKAQKLLDGVNPRASSILIGNKVDLHEHRKVSFEEGRLLARIHRLEYIETSARLNYNIDEAFQVLLGSVPDEYLHSINSLAARRWRLAASSVCAICRRKVERHATSSTTTTTTTTNTTRHRSRHDSSPSDDATRDRDARDRDARYRNARYPGEEHGPTGNLGRHRSYESLRDMDVRRDRKKNSIYI